MKIASPKLLLKTNHFIFPWFWSSLSMIFTKGRQDPHTELGSATGGRGEILFLSGGDTKLATTLI